LWVVPRVLGVFFLLFLFGFFGRCFCLGSFVGCFRVFVRVLRFFCGFCWVSSGKLWFLLCILLVYLGALYAFFNNVFTYQKKKNWEEE